MKHIEEVTEIINFLKAKGHGVNQYPHHITFNVGEQKIHVELSIRARLSNSQKLIKADIESNGGLWWQLRTAKTFKTFYESLKK